MDFWKCGFVSFLCAALVFTSGAVELGRNQPTERISGGVSLKFGSLFLLLPFCYIRLFLSLPYPSAVDLVGLVLF